MADAEEIAPRCITCGAWLPKFSRPGHRPTGRTKKAVKGLTGDGKNSKYGTRGDNIVCNTACAHTLLLRLFTSVPDIVKLLPPEWRFDLKPIDDSPKIQKLKKAAKKRAKWASRMWSPNIRAAIWG